VRPSPDLANSRDEALTEVSSMNQLLHLAIEACGGLGTFSGSAFPTLRPVVQRMSAGPALYGPAVILLQNANVAVVPEQRSKVWRDESISASAAIFGGGGDGHRGRHSTAQSTRNLNGRLKNNTYLKTTIVLRSELKLSVRRGDL
jgi:hypothetical protein